MFDDKWIDKEENSKLMDFVFRWLKPSSKLELDPRDTEDPNIGDLRHLPDMESLAERAKPCLQVSYMYQASPSSTNYRIFIHPCCCTM